MFEPARRLVVGEDKIYCENSAAPSTLVGKMVEDSQPFHGFSKAVQNVGAEGLEPEDEAAGEALVSIANPT